MRGGETEHEKTERKRTGVRLTTLKIDGKYLATGSEDGFLLVWEVKTGSLVYRSRTHSHWVWDLAWLPSSVSSLPLSLFLLFIRSLPFSPPTFITFSPPSISCYWSIVDYHRTRFRLLQL